PASGDPSEFDFYTKAHIRYNFVRDLVVDPDGNTFTLREIEEPNGNKISLYYNRADPRVAGLSPLLQSQVDLDSQTLDVITASSGRALVLEYQDFAPAVIVDCDAGNKGLRDLRIVKLTGFDPPAGNLLGLEIEYRYDEFLPAGSQPEGNLTSVTR